MHCMRMHVISVVTPTGFEEMRAEFAESSKGAYTFTSQFTCCAHICTAMESRL